MQTNLVRLTIVSGGKWFGRPVNFKGSAYCLYRASAFAVKSKHSMAFDKDFDAIMAVLEEDEDLEDHFDKEVQEV